VAGGTAMVDEYRRMFGLDKSIPEQYVSWMYNALVHRQLGPSFVNFPRPVSSTLGRRAARQPAQLALRNLAKRLISQLI
jgi:ABC-type dipeptide/oligopeptide/nickel transport system permease component